MMRSVPFDKLFGLGYGTIRLTGMMGELPKPTPVMVDVGLRAVSLNHLSGESKGITKGGGPVAEREAGEEEREEREDRESEDWLEGLGIDGEGEGGEWKRAEE